MTDIFKSADYARVDHKLLKMARDPEMNRLAREICEVGLPGVPQGKIFAAPIAYDPPAWGASAKLPVEMADWWYKFAYSIPKESTETVLPVFLTGAFMMERHPKFFHRDTVMTGPCGLFQHGLRDKRAETAKTFRVLSTPIDEPIVSFTGLLESIQDSLACEKLLGRIVQPLGAACDTLAWEWERSINKGYVIGPYIPMQVKREDDQLVFSSRFAEFNK